MYFYTVNCKFTSDDRHDVSASWLDWLKHGHIQDVVAGGASGAEIVRMTSGENELVFEIRYRFPDHETFIAYETNHAPRLREEGLAKFPLKRGLSYERTTGELLASI